jgi:hypothetical protein
MLRIPRVEDYFLSLPYENLSAVDQDILCERIRSDLSFLLPTIMEERLDFDQMASTLLSAVVSKHQDKPLREFLAHVFHIFFLVHPRYNMDLVSTVFKDRMNLFFYRLENLDELPVEYYYPSYHFLEEEQKQSFSRWQSRCRENFLSESLCALFTRNYPVLRVKLPSSTSLSVPKSILLGVETGDKLSLLHPYQDRFLFLPDVADSILRNQEYLVGNHPLPVDTLGRFFDLERVRAGLASYLMDNDYELAPTPPQATTTRTEGGVVEPLLTLPDFKKKAYAFLGSL